MNIRTPLAAALLMTSSAAMAQFFGPPEDDMIFKCGTVPYIACTDAQLARRATIQKSGGCPQPVTNACTDYMMRNGGSGVNPAETMAAKDPGAGNEWADPSCTQIPCRLKDKADADMPPAFDPKTFQSELAKIRAEAKADGDENTFVDLGNNRYGVVTPDGIVRACGPSSCNAKPLDLGKYPGLADKIQEAKSLNGGATSLNPDNPNGGMNGSKKSGPVGMTALSVPLDKGDGGDGTPTGGTGEDNPVVTGDGGSAGARSLGAGIAGDQANLAKGFGAFATGGTGGSGGSGGTGGDVAMKDEVVKVDGATVKLDGVFTYTRLKKNSDGIGAAAGTFNTGKMTGFASPADPGSGSGDPQVTPGQLGKIQAGANQ